MFLPAQCRAARGLLDWRQTDLADRAGVSRSTIRDFESEIHDLHRSTARQIIDAIEAAGVELIGDAEADAGVRFRPRGEGAGGAASGDASHDPAGESR